MNQPNGQGYTPIERYLETSTPDWALVKVESAGEDDELLDLTMDGALVVLTEVEARDLVKAIAEWLGDTP